MEWFKSLATFCWTGSESESSLAKDPDLKLLSLMVEKVLLPKMKLVLDANYDPMSTTKTLKVTTLMTKFIADFPTLSGDSRQIRELLTVVKDRIKASVDADLYIPIGYSKQ